MSISPVVPVVADAADQVPVIRGYLDHRRSIAVVPGRKPKNTRYGVEEIVEKGQRRSDATVARTGVLPQCAKAPWRTGGVRCRLRRRFSAGGSNARRIVAVRRRRPYMPQKHPLSVSVRSGDYAIDIKSGRLTGA